MRAMQSENGAQVGGSDKKRRAAEPSERREDGEFKLECCRI